MRFIWAALTIASTACASLAGESAVAYRSHPLTLDEAVQLSLRQNPSILSAVQQLKAEKGLLYQAQANLLPHLAFTANYTQQDPGLVRTSGGSSVPNFDLLALPAGQPFEFNPVTGTTNAVAISARQLFGSVSRIPTESWQVQLTASQLIYDGGATIASRRAARITEDAAYYSLRDTIDQVVSTVRTQFYQILLNRALIQVQEESVNLLQSQVDDQKSRFEAGTVPQFNVLQAQTSLQNQIPQLIAARNNYRISQVNLARTLGIPADRQYATDEPLPVVGKLDYNPIKYDLASALVTARANRPFLKAQRSSILSGVENVTVQAAGFKPTVSANVGLEQRSSSTSSNLRDTNQGWFFGFTGSWNIFDGGLTYGRVKQARAQLEQAKDTFDDSVRQVEQEVSTAVSNLRNAEETVISSQQAIVLAREALRLADERLAAGTGTQLDVLTQQTQLTTAESNLVQAEFNYVSAVSEFQRSTATEVVYNDRFDTTARPTTLTAVEAQKAARSRLDSPLDPDKPATHKSKRISLTPPAGKVDSGND
jgi:outer membrane protein TolC